MTSQCHDGPARMDEVKVCRGAVAATTQGPRPHSVLLLDLTLQSSFLVVEVVDRPDRAEVGD